MSFGFESTTDQVLAGVDLAGKRAIVTGASGGLGEETARALAAKGAAVTITARDLAKGEAAAQKIRESTGNAAVDVRGLELADLASVRAFAAGYLADHDKLDLLINNAGVMACPLTRTPAGWEMQFATNHVGHFLLTCLLAPALKAAAPSRVVNLSSAGHHMSAVDLDDPFFNDREYDKWVSYGQSKTANILFSVGLEKRLAGAGVHAYAVHPGGIMTELGRHLTDEDIAAMMERNNISDPEAFQAGFKTVPQGAATSVWAATSPELEGRGGLYCEDCHVAGPGAGGIRDGGYAPWALDPDAAERLWALSEELVDQRFEL
ncbi:MAG TPA: SDR family NAD(P)-dependent oxidoreductase [Pseudomonadales bacterium]|jgi:NAD(P)-dependent dehydrogenase (short-subunit alcohol dehydrogenase family)